MGFSSRPLDLRKLQVQSECSGEGCLKRMPRKRGRTAGNQAGGQRPAACPGAGWLGVAKRGHTGAGAAEGPPPRGRRPPAPRRAPLRGLPRPRVLTPAPQLPFRGDEEAVGGARPRNHRPHPDPRQAPIPVGPPQVLTKVAVSSCGEGRTARQTPPSSTAGQSRPGGPTAPQSPWGLRGGRGDAAADGRQAPCSRSPGRLGPAQQLPRGSRRLPGLGRPSPRPARLGHPTALPASRPEAPPRAAPGEAPFTAPPRLIHGQRVANLWPNSLDWRFSEKRAHF